MRFGAIEANGKKPIAAIDEREVAASLPNAFDLRHGQTGFGGPQEPIGGCFRESMKPKTFSKQSSHISHWYLSPSLLLQ